MIVMLPAQQNIHMPEDMRPLADVYLLLPDSRRKDVHSGKPAHRSLEGQAQGEDREARWPVRHL